MIAFFSVGLIFLSGVSYPMELMPWYWKAAHYILPAAPGTLAFCEIEFYGSQYGGYQTRIYNPLDTSTYLFYNKYMGLQEETGIRSN